MNADLATGDKRPHPLVGTVVEPYAIIDVIAAGGMGVVFKARHMLTDRIVAMKLLPSELARDESNVQRVKLEAKALAQLNHPNIVTTFDFGFTYMQEPFIVMEYVTGQSLKEVLDREVLLPVDRAIKIFLQAVDGMRYAHSAKILHRDLKPHNIMVSDDPEPDHVKILDFGVAKLAEYSQQITRTGEVVGSPLYMSPEQCTGRPTDHRCDIYSIGVMMFETLTGNPPFRGENYISTVHLKCTKLAPNFKDVVPGRVFPDRLETIVHKCLEIDPDKRYANMAELRADLELLAGGAPKGERKTSQNLGTQSSSNTAKMAENQSKIASSPGPGEIGWKPAWSGNDAPNTAPRTAADDLSDSIVTSTEPDRHAVSNRQDQPNPGNGFAASNTPSQAPSTTSPFSYSGNPHSPVQPPVVDPYDSVGPGRTVDAWRDYSSPNVAEDSWREPSSPNLSADDWNHLDSSNAHTGLTGQWPQSPMPPQASKPMEPQRPVETPQIVSQPPPPFSSSQDLASLSAALEASSVSGPALGAASVPQPNQGQNFDTSSQEITGDHPTVQVGSNTVPVPTPNKGAADSHFVLTWDSKSGPAWSATTAAPQKPRGPQATNTRNPIQVQATTPGQQRAIAPNSKPDVPQNHQPTPRPQAQNTADSHGPPGYTDQPPLRQSTPSSTPPIAEQRAEPAWTQAPPPSLQPSAVDGVTSGVINPASAYGWRPADPASGAQNEAAETQDPSSQNGLPSQTSQTAQKIPQGFPNPADTQGFTLPSHPGQNATGAGQQMAPVYSPKNNATGPHNQADPNQAVQPKAMPPHLQGPPFSETHSTAPVQQPNLAAATQSPNHQESRTQQAPDGFQHNAHPSFENHIADRSASSHTTSGGETDPWAEPSTSPTVNPTHTAPSTQPQPQQNAMASPNRPPQFSSAPSPWGPQPVPLDFLSEDKTVAVAKPPNLPSQSQLASAPDRTGAGSVVSNPVQQPPFGDPAGSPIQQLAQRMAESIDKVSDSVASHATNNEQDGETSFKNYEPVSLAELNAIKTPTSKAAKPAVDSGLSNMLPTPPTPAPLPQKRNRLEDDTESGARSAALRFNSSRGGNDGKKVVLMSLSLVAVLIILAIIGFKVYKYYEATPQKATTQEVPTVVQPDKTAQTTTPVASTSRRGQDTNATNDTTISTTPPATEKPAKSAQRPQPASPKKKTSVVASKTKKPKKAKVIAKAAPASSDVPAVKRRRAYSTYDSYYESSGGQ